MHAAITTAAALVAATCAEAAKSAGASREQVSSVISMGLDIRVMGDLLTLTTLQQPARSRTGPAQFLQLMYNDMKLWFLMM
jgi:hypothetical protein